MVGPAEFSEHRQQLVASHGLVSGGYDKQRFVRLCANRLVEVIGLRGGEKVLDVATSTGWTAMAAAQIVAPTGQVVGVDIAKDMLEQARRKMEVLEQAE